VNSRSCLLGEQPRAQQRDHPRPDPAKLTLGFWDVGTAGRIDRTSQYRIVELAVRRDGSISIWSTIFDHDAPPDRNVELTLPPLARLRRSGRQASAALPFDPEPDAHVGVILGDLVALHGRARLEDVHGLDAPQRLGRLGQRLRRRVAPGLRGHTHQIDRLDHRHRSTLPSSRGRSVVFGLAYDAPVYASIMRR
jgi:hypothetical protein